MQFETKRALLTYLGKNPDDNKLVDRMIKRGEAYREDGMYHLITNKQSLIEENRELKLEIMNMKKASLSDMERKELTKLIVENNKLNKELKEEKINYEYAQRSYEELLTDRRFRLEKAFQWIKAHVKGASWDEFYDWVMSDEE